MLLKLNSTIGGRWATLLCFQSIFIFVWSFVFMVRPCQMKILKGTD